ncbi:hypothetical protein HanXRQr2_Chr14g0660661 [Helianthus annuus]|uniref:Uncharacterized protein n=1 Tax=Helianthus annuus TaxID=4232 RepID=A0A9K3EB21_HELAN|nr:hypothetical protein HanXRQr2_Chr14g0660661 [Helianthus annuus]KAJ0487039.1 hypothetical protein HanHA89_Chr14g0586081 [Helianthus annuus]
MAANARFESASASSSEPSFSGPYSNGKRGNAGPNLDRSGSFREGAETRMFGSGFAVTRSGSSASTAAGSLPPLSQCLSLEPIQMGERKSDRSVELKRVMGIIAGSTSEDSSSGAAVSSHSKPSSPLAVAAEDLKRLRSSVVDTCNTARGRASKLDERLHKLDKYCDGVNTKKTQRSEMLTNDQAGSLNSKIGTQTYRNPAELVNQRVEDRPKNVLLNKRVRTSVAETRSELRSNGLRKQPVVMAKDRDSVKDNVEESDILEEKVQRLPVGGEGWDKKMKRKRSVGAGCSRPIDNNGDPKRAIQNKADSEPVSQPNDTHPYRLGASNGTGNAHKPDNKSEGSSLSNGSRVRLSPRNELEGPIGGSNKERILTKGNNKCVLNTRDDNYIPSGNLVTKGKATRGNRNGAMVSASSTPSTPRLSGTPESWENVTVTGGSKNPSNAGAVNRKRAMPTGPSSPNMAQWVGQRPQKMSRTRRSNLVSPVSNQEEKPLSSDSCSHSDVSARIASDATNGPVVSKPLKPKLEPVQSPYRLSESEESVVGQTQTVGPSLAIGMKAKSVTVINEESGDGVKRQGRSGRGPLIARASGDKLDNTPIVKPIRTNKPGSEKNGSKSGRPLKKLSDRKGFSRLGHLQNGGSDCTGKSDDDREELLAAANYARNASYLACSSAFWKKIEPIFAPVSSKDKTYLSTQLKEPDIQENFPQFHGRANNVAMNVTHEISVYDTNGSGERNMHVKHQGSESFSGRLDSDKTPKEFIPLFQRVLSALIIDESVNEFEEEENTENIPVQDTFNDSAYDNTFHHDDFGEPRKKARREVEQDTVFQSVHSVKLSFSSNGCTTANTFRSPIVNDSPCDDVAMVGISNNLVNRPQVIHMEGFGIPSFDNHNEQMRLDDKLLLELHSIGLYPELVPKLDDKEDEAIKQEINQLKTRLRQQNYKKKAYLEKICRSFGSSSVGRDLEQLAMDRLVELAYRKLLATRGPSRGAIAKIPKHVALAFGRRTLSRCRKFLKSGVSCFNMAPLRDILFAPPDIELEPPTKYIGFQNPHPDSRISSDEAFAINGPISNRGKKKELLLDDVSTGFGGATGKRAYQGERKMKATGGQIPNQSTRSLHPVQPSLIRESRLERSSVTQESNGGTQDIDPLLDPIDELGVGGPQDLSSLLNFDDEELQDHFSAGLEIPMDDLTELNMF